MEEGTLARGLDVCVRGGGESKQDAVLSARVGGSGDESTRDVTVALMEPQPGGA